MRPTFAQVPVYIDMIPTRTLHFVGDRDVQLNHSGHTKSRFTVALTCTAAGSMLSAYIVFRNLKRVPKVVQPYNVHVGASESGSFKIAEVRKKVKELVNSSFKS